MSTGLSLLAKLNHGLARVPAPTLDAGKIEAYAARAADVSRIPGEHWRVAFRALCGALEKEAALTPLGRIIANGQLVGLLKARCRAEQLLVRHPDIHELPVERPIIIMGPMRSGSTRLQRLLACDPRLRCTRLFESLFPAPDGRGTAKRIAAAAAVHTTLRALNPKLQQIHPSGPLRPDEEFGYLSFAFHSGQFAVQWDVPSFVAAEQRRDLLPVARELRTLVRINAWASRATTGRTVLKCPAYTGMAEALLATFPDAQLICLGRDPVKVVASSSSLVFEQRRVHSDTADPQRIGPEWLKVTAGRQRLLAAARTKHPGVPAFDLHYDELSRDWQGSMARLYRFLGLPLTAEVMAAMRAYLGKAKAHRGHSYRPEEFGLTEKKIRSTFGQPDRSFFASSAERKAALAQPGAAA